MPTNTTAMEDMNNAGRASESLLNDYSSKNEEMLRQSKNTAEAIMQTYKLSLDKQREETAKAYKEMIKQDEAYKKAKEKGDAEEIARVQKLRDEKSKIYEESQRHLQQENALYEQQVRRVDLQKLEASQQERINDLQKTAADMRSKNLSASSLMGSAKDFMTGGLKSSQVDTRGYELAAQNEEEQIALLKKQLETAEDSQKAEIAGQIQAHEDALKSIEHQRRLIDAMNSINTAFVQEIDKAVRILEDTELKSNTRLMGSAKKFTDSIDLIKMNLSLSPFVKTESVIKTMANAIGQGIVTNVEMRGFLESIKDGIVSTFDAFDERINRLIRVQQRDSTAARMGMESSLMQLYNQMFETSEYLQAGFDSVTDAIYEASAIVGAQQAEEMEFVMQKWLGSLYSVGMSQGAVTGIATAIGQLASGDVSQVGSGAQNLIAMALSRAGLSYDTFFTNGIGANDLNTLMASIVGYLQDIAETSQNNNVVQKELGNVFGVSMSDIKAATNLTAAEIKSLVGYTQSYGDAQAELQASLDSMITRMSKSVLLSNVYDNFMLASGMTIAENPVTYFMQKVLSVLPDMEIPMPQAMGSGISSGLPLKDLLQTALTGFGLLGGVINVIGAGISGSHGGLNLGAWNPNEIVARGELNTRFSSGFTQTLSGSQYAASGGSEDLKMSAMGMGKQQSEQAGETVGTGDVDTEYSVSNVYKLLAGIDENSIAPIDVVLASVKLDDTNVQNLIETIALKVLEKFTDMTSPSVKVEVTNVENMGSDGMYPASSSIMMG